MIYRARAPLRIDLAGGWTDVGPYAARRGGAVVNMAISLYAHATVRPGGEGIRLRALDLGAAVTARRPDELRPDGELALLKAIVRRHAPRAAEITTRSAAPPGSGLGGSGAMGVALVAALLALRGDRRLPAEIALEAFDIETRDAGVLGGRQDQYAAALGGVQFLSFSEPGMEATRLELPAGTMRELETRLVLCYSGASRLSAATHAKVWERYAAGDPGVTAALDGIRKAAFAMRGALLSGDLGRAGSVLAENWRHQCNLAEGMRTGEMDRLERAAQEAGAMGAKACGAGAGGCMVFLAPAGREFDLADALASAGGTVLPFTIDTGGVTVWQAKE
jgi:D-glycero-alpha-D-manno-heptose-7-phosphate kinase